MSTKQLAPRTQLDLDLREDERRATVRFACNLNTMCGRHLRPINELSWPAMVRDMSVGGIGLLLGRWFGLGTVLQFELHNQRRNSSAAVMVAVKHATRQDNGAWLIGCGFLNPLSNDQLHDLLAS